ncbi:uncharacterized protein DUF2550 [Murinocardiopsis flavida]|uniref:Uncharacterized protein DUF2550 n=1 Tax=Murinocardiopsis flavida TaxID=645275 RepID=A0A2P8CYD3_9ACTN|nr:DUF2550 domain-containing protein [Murinocardiopsis flavida]PSK89991.1 uncharacterized protein DUF2550 [Murinocardiopsis flavida]
MGGSVPAAAEWLLVAPVVLTLAFLTAVALRRYALERRGGGVECYLRAADGARPWRIGFARYGSEVLRWYRVFSLWPRPTVELSRRGLFVVDRRSPSPADLGGLTPDVAVIGVGWSHADGSAPTAAVYELAMSESALTGFRSWVESIPPGGA